MFCIMVQDKNSDRVYEVIGPFLNKDDAQLIAEEKNESDNGYFHAVWPMKPNNS